MDATLTQILQTLVDQSQQINELTIENERLTKELQRRGHVEREQVLQVQPDPLREWAPTP